MNKKKLKNYGLWIAVASAIILIVQSFGVQVESSKVMDVINAILGVLVLAGIINNPTSGNGFTDED